MRPVRLIGGLAFLLALTLGVRSEPLTGEVAVTTRTQVRSGPSEAFYATSMLVPGDRVTIVTEKEVPWLAAKPVPAGWLAIKPPRGSFSWVNKRFLTVTGGAATVEGDTRVRVGSSLYGGLPNVEQVTLQKGAIVTIVDKDKTDVDGIWVPIAPATQEVRYIPANAVQPAPAVQTASTAPPPVAPVPGQNATAPAPPPAPTAPEDPLWTQAKKAEQDGKRDEAERLYRQLAHQTQNHDLRIACWNQIHHLRQGQVAAAPANPQAPNPAASYYPQAANIQPIPAPGYTNQPPRATVPPIRPASQYTYTPEIPVPAPTQTPQANYSPSAAPPVQAPIKTLGPGILRVSSRSVYNQPGFFLDTGDGQPVYVTASPGLDLTRYVGSRVSLTGPVDYHPGYRRNHITVYQLIPVQ
jgi:hypothetical protein